MSDFQNGNVPAQFENSACSFIAANGTACKLLVDKLVAQAGDTTKPKLWGGGSVFDITVASADSSARDVLLYHGSIMTTQDGTNTGTMATTTGSVTRATGSFLADGWLAGDMAMVFAPKGAPNASVDGILAIVTSVAALGLTVNGTPFAALSPLVAGTRVIKVSPDLRANIPIGAGTNGTAKTESLLNHANDGSLVRYERKLGINDVLVAGMVAAVSALPAYVSVSAQLARY